MDYLNQPLAMFNFGPWEWVIVILAVLLLFGGKKLPELARGLGRGLRLFKEELQGVKKELEDDQPPSDQPRPTQQSDQDATKDQTKP
jgi:sec-independent protein translocase protein TatA